MNSKSYLKEKLVEIQNRFKELSIRYQFEEESLMHIVEVLPLDSFKENNEYINMESDLTFDFDNLFYPESVMFISEDSLTKITTPEYELMPEIHIEVECTLREDSSLNYIFSSVSKYDFCIDNNSYFHGNYSSAA